MDKDFLLDYTRFVDEVTSDASSDAQSFSDALEVIDGFEAFRSENRKEGDI